MIETTTAAAFSEGGRSARRNRRAETDEQHADLSFAPTLESAYRTLAPAILGYFRSHGLDHAEDLTGDVFVGVARGLRRFRGDEHDLRRWVFSIARRRLIDHFRRQRFRRMLLLGDHLEKHEAVVNLDDIDLESAIIDEELVAALQQLTDEQREVVVLRFVGDLPINDVADIVGRTTGAVKALQSRALAQLAKSLD